MKRNILSFLLGLVIGATPVIHLIYLAAVVAAFFVGKYTA